MKKNLVLEIERRLDAGEDQNAIGEELEPCVLDKDDETEATPALDNLERILFEQASKALDEYVAADLEYSHHALDRGFEGLRTIMRERHHRFCAIWGVIEAAELVDKYQAWKEGACA